MSAHPERDDGRREHPRSPAEVVLSLQRSAGNRAVGALLARAPEEPAEAKPEAASDAGARCTVSGVGTMELASYSVGSETGGASGAGRQPTSLLLSATTKQGKHTPKLMQAQANGSRHAVELVDRGMTTAGADGLFLSYQTFEGPGGDEIYESWTVRIEVPSPKPGA